MKKIKILFAVITVLTLLFTVVSASDSALKFGADTVDLDGDNVVLSVYAGADVTIRKSASFSVQYDDTVWSYVGISNALEGMNAVDYSGEGLPLVDVAFSKTALTDITTGSKVCDITFTKKAGEAYGTKFLIAPEDVLGNNLKDSTGAKLTYSGEITVKAAVAPEPLEKPTGVATTVEIDGTEYTNVPNATVSAVIPESGVIAGDVVATYWMNGFTALKNAVIPFTAGEAKVTGTGTVTFDVAITGVPSTVVITAIDIDFN